MIEQVNNDSVKEIISKYFNVDNPFNIYSKTIVYKENNNLCGVLVYEKIYERIEIDYIVVFEEYRKKGIGSKLVNYIKNNDISLEVNVNNKIAIDFYKKLGFEKTTIRKNYYNGEDAYLMCRAVK